jgi:hypothetical protein
MTAGKLTATVEGRIRLPGEEEVEACCKVQGLEQNSSHKRNLKLPRSSVMPLSWIGPVARRPTPGTLFGTGSARLTALVKERSAVANLAAVMVSSAYAPFVVAWPFKGGEC